MQNIIWNVIFWGVLDLVHFYNVNVKEKPNHKLLKSGHFYY